MSDTKLSNTIYSSIVQWEHNDTFKVRKKALSYQKSDPNQILQGYSSSKFASESDFRYNVLSRSKDLLCCHQ